MIQPDIELSNKNQDEISVTHQETSTVIDLTQNDYNKMLNSDRVTLMKEKLETVKNRIIHLKKVYNRWRIVNNTMRITAMSISFVLTVANAVINVMPENVGSNTVVRGLTAGFATFTAFVMVSSEGTLIAYVRRMINKYNTEIIDLQSRVDKSYLYYEKSRSDGVISNEELVKFFEIIKGNNIDIKI